MVAKKKRVVRVTHKFLQDRKLKEAYIVMRIDDYSMELFPSPNGFYHKPAYDDPKRGGSLWGTLEAAQSAAEWAANKWPDRTYGIFHMEFIVEARRQCNVTKL